MNHIRILAYNVPTLVPEILFPVLAIASCSCFEKILLSSSVCRDRLSKKSGFSKSGWYHDVILLGYCFSVSWDLINFFLLSELPSGATINAMSYLDSFSKTLIIAELLFDTTWTVLPCSRILAMMFKYRLSFSCSRRPLEWHWFCFQKRFEQLFADLHYIRKGKLRF